MTAMIRAGVQKDIPASEIKKALKQGWTFDAKPPKKGKKCSSK